MLANRVLSPGLLAALHTGYLEGIAKAVREDDTLMLAARGEYLNIYYRGGSLLKLEAAASGHSGSFDRHYLQAGSTLQTAFAINNEQDVSAWLATVPLYKSAIDHHLASTKSASEREFQQLVVWENNRSPIANETDFFITDIEFADRDQGSRVDMLGLEWPGHQRSSRDKAVITPVFIEMKYGINALGGDSGLISHLDDISGLVQKAGDDIASTIATQFQQLQQLELLKCKQKVFAGFKLNPTPKVVFLLANCNPRSARLRAILGTLQPRIGEYSHLDILFFTAGFAGYAMHTASMLPLREFTHLLDAWMQRAR